MALRKCIFIPENYSERGFRKQNGGTTTEFINKPVNYRFMGFYISTRIAPELASTTLKTGLTKSHGNLRLLSLAREFNFVREIGRIAHNVGSYTQVRIAGGFLSSRKEARAERCPPKTTAAALDG
jgi:hypothetical protein